MKTITHKFVNGLFYPSGVDYLSIPDGAIDVSEDAFTKAMNRHPGESFTVDSDGIVTIISVPAPTHEQLIALAEQERSALRSNADSEIVWRQDAVDAGIATDEETFELSEWKKYRVLLMRVDTSKAPDIEWPTPPVE